MITIYTEDDLIVGADIENPGITHIRRSTRPVEESDIVLYRHTPNGGKLRFTVLKSRDGLHEAGVKVAAGDLLDMLYYGDPSPHSRPKEGR